MKSILAISILAAASQSHATLYNVTGSFDGINTIGATSDPKLYVHTGTTAYSTTANTFPTFSGQWDVNTASPSVTGTFADFAQYSTSVYVSLLFASAVVNQPHLVYSFNNGTASYDAATRTFTLGQPLTFYASGDTPSTAPGMNAQSSDAALTFDTGKGAQAGVCTGNSTVCTGQTDIFLATPNLEMFYMTLTFSADFQTFTGTAVGADVGGALASGVGVTGNTWYSYSFNGQQAVPVPAAAWLMGSGLVGLAGVARRRRSQS